MQPSGGLNQGLAAIAFGGWVLCDFFSDGDQIDVTLQQNGQITSSDPTIDGLWNTDHNGLNQAAACVFVTVRKSSGGQRSSIQTRLNFSATPIVAQDSGAAKITTYNLNTDNLTLGAISKKVGRVLTAFQLFATSN